MLQERHTSHYQLIQGAVRQIFPRFKDFSLRPSPLNLIKSVLSGRSAIQITDLALINSQMER